MGWLYWNSSISGRNAVCPHWTWYLARLGCELSSNSHPLASNKRIFFYRKVIVLSQLKMHRLGNEGFKVVVASYMISSKNSVFNIYTNNHSFKMYAWSYTIKYRKVIFTCCLTHGSYENKNFKYAHYFFSCPDCTIRPISYSKSCLIGFQTSKYNFRF